MTKSKEQQSSQDGVKRYAFTQIGRKNSLGREDGNEWRIPSSNCRIPSSSQSSNNLGSPLVLKDGSALQLGDVWSFQNLNINHSTHNKSDKHNSYASRQYYSRYGGLADCDFQPNIKCPLMTEHSPAGDSKGSWKRPTGHGLSCLVRSDDAEPTSSERRGSKSRQIQGTVGNIQSTGLMKGGLFGTDLQKSRRF